MKRVGFIGLGVMGVPMALNLSRVFTLSVWNRSPSKYPLLLQAGAKIAKTSTAVVKNSEVIFTMLFNETAMREVLTDEFKHAIRGKTLINTSSVSVQF